MKIYLYGNDIEAANAKAAQLTEEGHEVINAAEKYAQDGYHTCEGVVELATCEALCLLDGWEIDRIAAFLAFNMAIFGGKLYNQDMNERELAYNVSVSHLLELGTIAAMEAQLQAQQETEQGVSTDSVETVGEEVFGVSDEQ